MNARDYPTDEDAHGNYNKCEDMTEGLRPGSAKGASGGGSSGDCVIVIEHSQRKYLPTLSDLVDRLSIVQLKAVFIPEHTEEYVKERALIEHDVDLILNELAKNGNFIKASHVHAIIVLAIANRFIWENESKARAGGSEHDHLLKLTHSINGVRNTAKNQLAAVDGGRRDYKVDSLAAELPPEFGNWKIFE